MASPGLVGHRVRVRVTMTVLHPNPRTAASTREHREGENLEDRIGLASELSADISPTLSSL